jgi:hypothetical protein
MAISGGTTSVSSAAGTEAGPPSERRWFSENAVGANKVRNSAPEPFDLLSIFDKKYVDETPSMFIEYQ